MRRNRGGKTEKQSQGDGLAGLLTELEGGQLSSIGRVVSEVIGVLTGPGASVRELKQIIEIDPPLAARILHLANSAFYSRGRSYSTIEDAIILIGFEAALRLVLSQKVCDLFAHGDTVETYARARLWRHSVATAVLARFVHRREFALSGETAYACGLLHDLGLVIVDQFRHDPFLRALRTSFAENCPLIEVEREMLGFDHGEVLLEIIRRWGLPREVVDCLRYMRDPFAGTGPNVRSALVLFVANDYCRENGFEHGALRGASNHSLLDGLSALGVSPAALEKLGVDLKTEIAQLEDKGLI